MLEKTVEPGLYSPAWQVGTSEPVQGLPFGLIQPCCQDHRLVTVDHGWVAIKLAMQCQHHYNLIGRMCIFFHYCSIGNIDHIKT